MNVEDIPGWGVDRDIESRPGYPLIQEWRVDHDTLQGENAWKQTVPPKRLSGRLRHVAYGIPTHKTRRWMLLLLADRVDAIESKLTARNLLLTAGAIGGVAAAGIYFARKRLR